METQHIIAGFTEIKSELKRKTKSSKNLSEITLWFHDFESMILVYDYFEPENSMLIAAHIMDNTSWTIYLPNGGYGWLILDGVLKQVPRSKVCESLNEYYKEFGFASFSRF